jgi:hypothetical protein
VTFPNAGPTRRRPAGMPMMLEATAGILRSAVDSLGCAMGRGEHTPRRLRGGW